MSRSPAARRRRVLLVEDNPDEVLLTLSALREAKLRAVVEVARDGQEALDILFPVRGSGAKSGASPSLVLLDLKLPKVHGLDVLRLIREARATKLIPVVVLTSSTQEQDMVESYARGANSYVRKPANAAAFVEALRQLGLYWLLVNEPPPEGGPDAASTRARPPGSPRSPASRRSGRRR